MFSVRTFIRGVLTRQKHRNEILRAPRRFPPIRSFLENILHHDETIKNCCLTAFIGYLSYELFCELRGDALKRKNEEYEKLLPKGLGNKKV